MKFNRKKFFDGVKDRIDPSLSQEQVNGLEFLLTSIEQDSAWKNIRHVAYALATVFHETAGSFQPVEEGYYLGSKARVKRFQKTLRYYPYFGRGYVQLTWETKRIPNYSKAGKALGIDFVANPDLVMEPINAYKIMTLGMYQGWFTTKKLSDYISGSKTDYVNARRIINGLDKAGLIAGYARSFEQILLASSKADDIPHDAPTETTTVGMSDGEIISETTKNEQDITETVEVEGVKPYNEIGLGGTLKNDAKAILPANIGLNTISEWIAQTTGWPPWVSSLIPKLVIAALIVTVIWILYRGVSYVMHSWRENERVKLLASINSDINKKDVILK